MYPVDQKKSSLRAVLVIITAFLLGACGPSDQFTGRWTTPGEGTLNAKIMPNHFELVLGQYGSEISGVLRVYSDPFQLGGWEQCPCMYLTNGQLVGDEASFILRFEGCEYMEALYPQKQLLLLLSSDGDLSATGDIFDITGTQVLQSFTLERSDFNIEQIEDIEKTCETDP